MLQKGDMCRIWKCQKVQEYTRRNVGKEALRLVESVLQLVVHLRVWLNAFYGKLQNNYEYTKMQNTVL